MKLNRMQSPSRQSGAIMVVSLILLLIMTLLALGASQTTRLQERMAGNSRDADIALQSAEAGLRDGERFVNSQVTAPSQCATLSSTCKVFQLGILPSQLGIQSKSWWDTNGTDYRGAGNQIAKTGSETMPAEDPKFVIEQLEEIADSLAASSSGPPPARLFYRVTSESFGASSTAQAVLQTTYAKAF